MQAPDLNLIFSALADPTRRAILVRLSEGEAPVKELAAPFEMSGPAITKHLKVLEHAGLISRSRDGQQRPCRLEPQGLEPAAEWIEAYRAMWEDQLDRLGAYLKSVAPLPADPLPETTAAATSPSTTARPSSKHPTAGTSRGRRHAPRK